VIEACVWAHVKAMLADPAVLRTQYAQGRGDPAVDVRAEQERVRLERKLAALDRAVTRLVDAYQAEVIERSELAERRRRIDDHGRMLRERVREIAQQRSERSAELRLLEGVDAFCTSIREAMEEPCLTVQQQVLQLGVNRIVVEDNHLIIEHVVPTGPVRLQTEQHMQKTPCPACSCLLPSCSPLVRFARGLLHPSEIYHPRAILTIEFFLYLSQSLVTRSYEYDGKFSARENTYDYATLKMCHRHHSHRRNTPSCSPQHHD